MPSLSLPTGFYISIFLFSDYYNYFTTYVDIRAVYVSPILPHQSRYTQHRHHIFRPAASRAFTTRPHRITASKTKTEGTRVIFTSIHDAGVARPAGKEGVGNDDTAAETQRHARPRRPLHI